MTPPPPPADDARAEELDRLVDDYLRRLRAGERPSVAEIAAAHPALAERILQAFPAVAAAEGVYRESGS